MFLFYSLFVVWITVSAYVQVADHPLRKVISPGLTAACGLQVLAGTLVGNVSLGLGLPLAGAIFLLAASDFTFERTQARPDLFPIAMALGVLSGFIIGVTFNLNAAGEIPGIWYGLAVGAALAAAGFVYRFLSVPNELRIPVYIYLLQAVILLAGGLASFYAGSIHFGIWGLFLFISDSLVGLRAFPNPRRPLGWLNARRILIAILLFYYTAMAVMVTWALA